MGDLPLPVVDRDRDRERLVRGLRELIQGEVRFGRHDRLLYATDASIYQVEPIGVVIPRSVAEIEAVVRFCAREGLPVLPRGGGTSLAGQAVNDAVVIDCSRHVNRLLAVDPEAMTAQVEPGLVLDDLNRGLEPYGLMFGPDVATSAHANLGGMIGNNSAGARSILYGRTVEHVAGLDVVLAGGERVQLDRAASAGGGRAGELAAAVAAVVEPIAGEIDTRFPRIVRHVDGYNLDLVLDQVRRSSAGTRDAVNLASLLCGSEGTLAVTVGATLSLVPLPAATGLGIVAFADVDEALAAVAGLLETGPSAVELIDDVVIDAALGNNEYRSYVELLPRSGGRPARAVLYVEHFAESERALRARLDELEARFGADRVSRAVEPAAMADAWKLRKAGEPLLHGMPGRRKPVTFVEDLAVDPAVLPEFVREFRAIVDHHGTRAAYFAHASVGCLHIRPLVDLGDPGDVEIVRSIAAAARDLVMRYGGALSGEHGDGRLRSHMLRAYFGEAICDGFAAIKAIFDPEGRLNPGIITEPAPMLEHLRVRPEGSDVAVPAVETYFRYEREHGFDEAVTRCNGAGVCRRTEGGTMCPSYRALRDERHATRGRGNALRLAITGQLSPDGRTPAWQDAETKATLDLCLSCKACKSECPSNVDIARLKAEYLAQGYRVSGGAPLAASVFGHVRTLNRLGSRLAPLSNWLIDSGLAGALAARLLGVDRRRYLPRFERSLHRWFERRPAPAVPGDAPAVILFPDCFTVYNEPEIGRHAIRTLEAFGYRVVLPDLGCCGRSLISVGMLEEAIETCTKTARGLSEAIDRHDAVAVVGCEPSCVSAITDDWTDLDLPLERALVERLAQAATLVESFLERRWGEHPRRPLIGNGSAPGHVAGSRPVLLHGHCHQKALWGLDEPAALLRRIVGERLVTLDSGCCGMAGSFGYTSDHYALSMQVGEQSLFPPIRSHPGAVIVAGGTSCRHQIREGAGRRAVHPLEVVGSAIAPPEVSRCPA